jgi:hypothetical protein
VSIVAMLPSDTTNKSMPKDLLRHFDLVVDMFDSSCEELDAQLSRAIFSGCNYNASHGDEVSLSEWLLVSSHMQVPVHCSASVHMLHKLSVCVYTYFLAN